MNIVSVKAGARAFRRKRMFRGELLCLGYTALGVSLTWGCGGVTSGKSAQTTVPGTFTISGAISPSAGGNGATLTLSGVSTASATADSAGNYTFTGFGERNIRSGSKPYRICLYSCNAGRHC